MAGNLIYITDAGRAALVAPGNTGTTAHQVTQIGLATAAFVFEQDMTALPSELKRITTFGGDTVANDTIHIVIQDDSADQYKLYGFGLYLDDDVLFGVYVQNDPILEKAAASMLLLAADTVFASIDVTKLVFGPTSFLNPPATIDRKGVVELATQAEVDAGADDTRAVTPKTAATRYAALAGARFSGNVSAAAGIASTGPDSGGANFRAVNGQYGALLRNDGTAVHLLSTKSGGAEGLYNDFRPFSWDLASGDVTIAGNGSSTVVGGRLTALDELKIKPGGEGVIRAGSNDGYFFGNSSSAGWYSPTNGSFQYHFAERTLKVNDKTVWHEGNLTPLDRNLGGQVNGTITLYGAGDYGSPLVLNAGGYAPRLQSKASTQEWMVTNGANTAANLIVSDNGRVNFPRARPQWAGGLTPFDTGNFDPNSKVNKAGDTMTGDLRIKQPNNTEARGFIVARADGTAQAWFHGTMNGNYSAWATMNPDGSWKSNPIIVYNDDNRVLLNSDVHVFAISRFYNRPMLNRDGWQADLAMRNNRPGYDSWTYLRARDGGGMEIINNAYNAVTWSVDDWGTMYMRGQQILNTDGNLKLAFRGGLWLSDQLANIDNALGSKANAGARVQWDSGVNNFGTVDRLGGALPAPWVVCGLSGPGNATANAITVYGVLLRNR
ncbi:phage tail protein [Burkholderia glumae]|uniref:phage tail fiber protein n=1 Tax=Burkholderia glumae TaxID=337 RepID=UPI002151EFAB|nr:phage tail protein [Burkholderia glumae]UVS99063.1 phage tail protein [Burkholderia glumae]